MFSSFRNRFGIPGVISVIALVFAMLGGAYAASNDGGSGKATASAKGKPGPRGPRGKPGPAGPAGPQGPAGANGANGAKGDKGDAGSAGANGTNGATGATGASGKSVTVTKINPLTAKCAELGGAEVKVEGAGSGTEVCNGEPGEQGEDGEEGSPWTAGGTLPVGSTETGTWAFHGTEADTKIVAPISFTIPLAAEPEEGEVHFQTDANFETKCPGFVGEPTAPSGELCVYFSEFGGAPVNATFKMISVPYAIGLQPGALKVGATLTFAYSGEPGKAAYGGGTWAVTG